MVKRYLGTIFICILTIIGNAFATPQIRSQIAPKEGSIRTSFILSISIEGAGHDNQPTLVAENDFTVRYIGPQQNIQIINGAISTTSTYRYKLKAKQNGELKSPTFSIQTDEGNINLEPQSITVSEDASADKDTSSDKVTLNRTISNNNIFKGQQILETVEIETAVALQNVQLSEDTPSAFVVEPVSPDEQDRSIRNGMTFTVARKRRALFPIRAGDLELPPKTLTAHAIIKRSLSIFNVPDPFGDDVFDNLLGASEDIDLNSPKEIIHVKDLPVSPTEADFWKDEPLVGTVKLSSEMDSKIIDPGETKTIELVVEGDANIKALTDIPFPRVQTAKVYPEAPQILTEFKGDKVLYTKKFKYSLVATSGGNIKIPAFELWYFNPEKEQYEKTSTGPFTIIVTGEPEPTQVPPSPTPHKKVESLPLDSSNSVATTTNFDPSILIGVIVTVIGFLVLYLSSTKIFPRRAQNRNPIISFDLASGIKEIHERFLYNVGVIFNKNITSRLTILELPIDNKIKREIESFLDLCEEGLYGNKVYSDVDIKNMKKSASEIVTALQRLIQAD